MDRISKALCNAALLIAMAVIAFPAASQGTFRLTAIYSSPSGGFQMIQLQEAAGSDKQDRWQGLTLVTTSVLGVVKTLTFPRDLPSSSTAARYVMIGTLPESDFVIPERFLPMEGGTITFANTDSWTFGAMPTDGLWGVRRDPNDAEFVAPVATFRYFDPNLHPTPTDAVQRYEEMIEYVNVALERYFVTVSAPDIDALDSGRIEGWERSGESTRVWVNGYYSAGAENPSISAVKQPEGLLPVCRLYLPPPMGPSHFYSASSAECTEVLDHDARYVLETWSAFLATMPDVHTGACDQNATPLYRLWNTSDGASHRFTSSRSTRDAMIAKGWIPEGYGADGVAMCAWGYL